LEKISFVEMESSKLFIYLFGKHVWKRPMYYKILSAVPFQFAIGLIPYP
jgi:hypothetical protein